MTINSDDPMYFECSVAGDLRQVAALTELDVERHTRYAIEAAFADEGTKQQPGLRGRPRGGHAATRGRKDGVVGDTGFEPVTSRM